MLATITFGEILKVGLMSGAIGVAVGLIFGTWLAFKIVASLDKEKEKERDKNPPT